MILPKEEAGIFFQVIPINITKVLMYYTLKCDAVTTQDNYACGEWDYTILHKAL